MQMIIINKNDLLNLMHLMEVMIYSKKFSNL